MDHVACIPVRHPETAVVGRHYGCTVQTCVPFVPSPRAGSRRIRVRARQLGQSRFSWPWTPGQVLAALSGYVRRAEASVLQVPEWLDRLLAGISGDDQRGRDFSNPKARCEIGWELGYPSWR